MMTLANELVEQKADLNFLQRQNLGELFSLTLSDNPSKRTWDFDKILNCLTLEK